jgi:hypothetical protein
MVDLGWVILGMEISVRPTWVGLRASARAIGSELVSIDYSR